MLKTEVSKVVTKEAPKIESYQVEARNIFVTKIIKTAVFGVIGLCVAGGTFFYENSYAKDVVLEASQEFQAFDYNQENVIPGNGLMRFQAEEGEIENVSVSPVSIETKLATENNEYIFDLKAGRLWGNFLISDAGVNIVMDKVVVIPENAAFDLEFDGTKIDLAVYNGDVYVGFLEEGMEIIEYNDKYSSVFSNRMLVPRDTKVQIALSKVDERIDRLFYSKLIKEFKYTAVTAAMQEDEWVKNNKEKDGLYIESVKRDFSSEVIRKGLSSSEGSLAGFVYWAEENLTFIPEKKAQINYERLFSYMDDAIFWAVSGDNEKALNSLGDFYSAKRSLSVSQNELYEEQMSDYVKDLIIFGPGDDQYVLPLNLLLKKFNAGDDKYEIVDNFWNGVYRAMDIGDHETEQAINRYFEYFDVLIDSEADGEKKQMYLSFQNQLFDNLFLRYPLFYKDAYFAIKDTLEEELLNFYPEGQEKEEISQAFISRKIDFLKRLRKHFFDEEVTVQEAKEILSRLVEEVNDLMPSESDSLAVTELFESQLEDIGNFWGYLNSPEYHVSFGVSHEEKYDYYLLEKDKIWSFIDIQSDVLGEEAAVDVSVQDVENAILEYFFSNEQVTNMEVGEIIDVNQRYVEVAGIIGGYGFDATYDRDQQTLTEVYVYGELISEKTIKLDKLLSLFQDRFADLVEEDYTGEEEITEESIAQRRARIYIAEELAAAGFLVEFEDVEVVDMLESIYRVNEIYYVGYENTIITFDYIPQTETATNLYMVVDSKPMVLDGEYTLEQLKDLVIAENDFSEGEKLGR